MNLKKFREGQYTADRKLVLREVIVKLSLEGMNGEQRTEALEEESASAKSLKQRGTRHIHLRQDGSCSGVRTATGALARLTQLLVSRGRWCVSQFCLHPVPCWA